MRKCFVAKISCIKVVLNPVLKLSLSLNLLVRGWHLGTGRLPLAVSFRSLETKQRSRKATLNHRRVVNFLTGGRLSF